MGRSAVSGSVSFTAAIGLARGLKPTALFLPRYPTALSVPRYSVRAAGFRGCRKSRLTQVSCVGAHSRAPYKPLIKQGMWAHSRAPLQALIKIKWGHTTPSLACGPVLGQQGFDS